MMEFKTVAGMIRAIGKQNINTAFLPFTAI